MANEPNRQTYLEVALADGHVQFSGEGRNERVYYVAAEHSGRYSNPEEKVVAELWAELIYRYEYSPERIGFQVTVPGRVPNQIADLVVFEDEDQKVALLCLRVQARRFIRCCL